MAVPRVKLILLWVLMLAVGGGCGTLHRYQSDWALKHQARVAYKRLHAMPPCMPTARHYQRGWYAGYCNVATGGKGAPPPLPPEAYWSFKYQNPDGHAAIQTWYHGFQDGAQGALLDGVQQFNYLPPPPTSKPLLLVEDEVASGVASPPPQPPAPQALGEEVPARGPLSPVVPTGPRLPVAPD